VLPYPHDMVGCLFLPTAPHNRQTIYFSKLWTLLVSSSGRHLQARPTRCILRASGIWRLLATTTYVPSCLRLGLPPGIAGVLVAFTWYGTRYYTGEQFSLCRAVYGWTPGRTLNERSGGSGISPFISGGVHRVARYVLAALLQAGDIAVSHCTWVISMGTYLHHRRRCRLHAAPFTSPSRQAGAAAFFASGDHLACCWR